MTLYEEAPRISILGVEMYAYGLHIAAGILAAVVAMAILARAKQMKKGTVPLMTVCGILLGGIFSRLFFCLMDQSMGMAVPFSSWFQITGGGWSMAGMIAGVFLAAWLSGKISGQDPMKMLDLASCAIPAVMMAERLGDRLIEDFNTSRPLTEGALANSFLAVQGDYDTYLRTYYLCAAAALILFLVLCRMFLSNRRNGNVWIAFLLLCGGGGILLESLRYDYFLSITFVRLQQVVYALMLLAGTILAAVRAPEKSRVLRWAAPVSVALAVGAVIGIEFAIDRSDVSNLLLYGLMILVIAVPVTLGFLLLKGKGKEEA